MKRNLMPVVIVAALSIAPQSRAYEFLPINLTLAGTENLIEAEEGKDGFVGGTPGVRLDLALMLDSYFDEHLKLYLTGGIEKYKHLGVNTTYIMDGMIELDQEQSHTRYRLGIRITFPVAERWAISIGGGGYYDEFSYHYLNYEIVGEWEDNTCYGMYGAVDAEWRFFGPFAAVFTGEYCIGDYSTAIAAEIPNYTDDFIALTGFYLSVGLRWTP